MNNKELDIFIDKVFEIAFGDDALNKDYSPDDVLNRLQQFSDKALILESLKD